MSSLIRDSAAARLAAAAAAAAFRFSSLAADAKRAADKYAGLGPGPPVLVADIVPGPCWPVWLGVIPGLAAWLAARVAARKDVDRG